MEIIFVMIGVIIATAVYFLPTIVAFNRGHASKMGIFIVNFLFGFTFLFWIVALVWAFSNKGQQQVIIYNNQGTHNV